jgi:hypothetical protein
MRRDDMNFFSQIPTELSNHHRIAEYSAGRSNSLGLASSMTTFHVLIQRGLARAPLWSICCEN